MSDSIRGEYQIYGVNAYYQQYGESYRNPHEPIIWHLVQQGVLTWGLNISHVLDLACGSGEVTLALRAMPQCGQLDGIDPYTAQAYLERTGQAVEPLTFEAIAQGALVGRQYSLIVCSFAMHLLAESWLPALSYQLAQTSPHLLILTPHKRPDLKSAWGWALAEEMLHERVRARLYNRT